MVGPFLPALLSLAIGANQPQSFKIEGKTALYSYSYEWPREAVAIPALNRQLTGRMNKNQQWIARLAEAGKKEGGWFPPDGYASSMGWETAGQSPRLLSLGGSQWSFTGGAHGNGGSMALLWDRKTDQEVAIKSLLQPGKSWTGAIRQPFCVLLDREREERRGEPVKKDDLFGSCPGYDEVTVLLRDSDGNGRFDHVDVTADQYVAGPYAEGPYEISLPITAAMIERLKPEYRPSFEPRLPIK